jgi:RNA polymerase sigma-70 factor (ECF subfamily)
MALRGGGRAGELEPELARAVERLRSAPGDEVAARAFDRLLRPRLAAYFRAGGAGSADVEDLVQETLLRVYSGMAALRSAESFLAWLFTIARNARTTRWERRERDPLARAQEIDADEAHPQRDSGAPDAERRTAAAEAVGRLEQALAELPPRQRQCLLLQAREELSYGEIAALLGTSVLTVRNHLRLARAELRRRFSEER